MPGMARSTATTPGSHVFPTSPGEQSIDFLSFMGLDQDPTLESAEAGPSRTTRASHKAQDHGGEEEDSRKGMQVDSVMPFGPSQVLGLAKLESTADFNLDSVIVQGHSFDAAQAHLLQQQLEHIHMRSPLTFQLNNAQPSFPVSQVIGNSPLIGIQLPTATNGDGHANSAKRRESTQNRYGALTPGSSGDMFPQSRNEHMSPMPLEMLGRTENEYNMTPLLSPALSAQHSAYASPAKSTAFQPSNPTSANRSPLEQLQEQQKQFQEQLAQLQQQQKEMQATAAAVVAAAAASNHSSPYVTPGNSQHQSGSIGAASPAVDFSPLTSPALEDPRSNHHQLGHQQHQHQLQRQHHSFSALSSPALNPVGSSGGAQQTLSPALLAQPNRDSDNFDYAQAFTLDHGGHDVSQMHRAQGGSDPHQSSPLVQASRGAGAGPHRHGFSSKTRPSPMMKPVNHRSHGSKHSTSGTFSVPTSPAIQRVVSQGLPAMGYLPPAAMQQQSGGQHAGGSSHSGMTNSTASTPSPVDLSQIMPPPPVPASGLGGMVPMTPASLMNLAKGEPIEEQMEDTVKAPDQLPPRPAGRRAAQALKKTTTSRLTPNTAGKRALAMRPPAGAAGRANAKNATAAALVDGENRKTSHKAAEQKRRDSLKVGFDELRLLLPPINTEALDPESGEPIPGSSAPRLLPKSSLVPDDNPNRGVSKVALLKFSNEYIVRLHDKVEKRDEYIERLRREVYRLRIGSGEEVRGESGEDLLEMDMLEGEEDDLADEDENQDQEDGMEDLDDDDWSRKKGKPASAPRRSSVGGRRNTVKAR